MKKKLVNKKVVNSIGIGIMAFVMAGSPSLTVLASELPEAEPDNNGISEDQTPGTSSQEEVRSEATEKIEDAHTKNEYIKTEVEQENIDYQNKVSDEKYGEDDKGPVSDPSISENLEKSQDALNNLGGAAEELDELNAAADNANTELEEAVEKLEDGLEEELESLDKAVESLDEFEKVTTEEKATKAETTANDIENAQQQTYETEDEAKAAQDKAKAEAAELEMAKKEALEQQEKAQEEVEKAEAVVKVLERDVEDAENAYNEAVEAVNKANEKLEKILGDLGISIDDLEIDEQTEELKIKDTMGPEVRAALQGAWDAWKQAEDDLAGAETAVESAEKAQEKAERDYGAAKDELDTITEALKKLTTAEGVLKDAKETEESTRTDYNNLQAIKDEATNADEAQKIAQNEYDDAKQTLKDAQQDLLAKTANEQAEASKSAYKDYENAKRKDEEQAHDAYIAATDAQTETMIKYQLQKEGIIDDIEEVTFSNWVSKRGENNYVVISYPAKDEDGNICRDENGDIIMTQAYYDYIENEGEVTVLKKEISESKQNEFELGDGSVNSVPLRVGTDTDGESCFYLGDIKLNGKYVIEGDAITGYCIKNKENSNDTVKITISDQRYNVWINGIIKEQKELTTVTLNGETIYFMDGKKADVKLSGGYATTITTEDGTYSVTAGASLGEMELDGSDIVFGPIFKDKGTEQQIGVPGAPDKDKSELETVANAAKADKTEKENSLTDANIRLENANTAWDAVKDKEGAVKDAWENAVGAVAKAEEEIKDIQEPWTKEGIEEKNVKGYLMGVQETKTPIVANLLKALDKANASVEAKEFRGGVADKVNQKMSEAYANVVAAIQELYRLQEKQVSKESEWNLLKEQCQEAIDEYVEAAAKYGVSQANCKRIEEAADRAIEAAGREFAVREQSTTGGGTGGGTTDGEESGGTGGGTSGGGTGGATDDGTDGTTDGAGGTTAVVPGAPVTNIPAAEVPLAASDMAGTGTVLSGNAMTAGTGRTGAGARATGNRMAADGEEDDDIVLAGNDETIGGGSIILEDEEVPLAASGEMEDTEGVVDIEDGETPLTASASEQTKMSWWWWLIVLVLGATGAEMYRRHRKKLAEEDAAEN